MNFLALVNAVRREAGTDMDSLSDFSSLDVMDNRFKEWTAQAWKEICMERDEWEYTTGLAVVDIYPRLFVENWERAGGIPSAGATYVGSESTFPFTLVSVDSVEGTITDVNGLTAFIDISNFNTSLLPLLNETFDEVTPSADTDVFVFKGWGRYNLQTYTDTVVNSGTTVTYNAIEPQLDTLYIQDVELDDPNLFKVAYVPYARYVEMAPEYSMDLGKPQIFTTTPDGRYDFWPRPDKHYVLKYNYTRAVNELTLATDVPQNLPDEYHDAIVWRAVSYYALYDQDINKFKNATRRYMFYKGRMDKRLMPTVSFGRNRYYD